jgi:cytochrome c
MSEKMLAVVGSVLAALLVIVGVKTFIDMSGGHKEVGKAGYELPDPNAAKEAETAAAATGEAAPGAASDGGAAASSAAEAGGGVVEMVATADAATGKKVYRRCAACHTSKKGEKPALGPNLWGIVGRDVASQEAFTGYSDAMKAKEGNWTLEELAVFLKKPKAALPGTRMIFGGIKKDKDLANLLAHLKTLSDGG